MFKLTTKQLSLCKVLIVDDDNISTTVIKTVIEEICQADTVASAKEAFDYCKHQLPDLMIVDVNMPDIDGLAFCKSVKQNVLTEDIPVIFITADVSKQSQLNCWEAGGNDFVTKPVIAQTLTHRVKNHLLSKLRLDAMMVLTFKDPLTGLYNRNFLTEEYPRLSRQLTRDHKSLGVIIFDVDDFKQYNDTYGHQKGDVCLQKIAEVLSAHARRARDAMVRYGGEEFIALLPDTTLKDVKQISSDILAQINHLNITHIHSSAQHVTLSAGITCIDNMEAFSLSEIIEQADINLYDAKKKGKNQVVSC